jgi:NDP-sugar pyrophosphorylase family protein
MTPVLVMAGGRGLRLHPLTEHAPKPLVIPPSTTEMPGGKPILETIIDRFRDQGFKRIWLSVHYRAELIEGYFGNGDDFGVKIKYIHEDEPMGTGGALNLAPRFEVPFIVVNADVLTDMSYGRLMSAHGSAPRLATICTALHQVQLPFGVVESENDRMTAHREKPIEGFAVNAGIYVLDPKALERARRMEGAFSMPDLLEACMPAVGVYPIRSFWLDVGHFEDLGRSAGRMG